MSSFREALAPTSLRAALAPDRPVFANPWDSTEDIFATYVAISFVSPLLLWAGGGLMGAIFNFSSRWPLGVYIAASVVGAAGFMTIVGRRRTRLSVDFLAIAAWFLLGLVVAPILGLAPSPGVAIICYAIVLGGIFLYVLRFGHFEVAFFRTLTWPIAWTGLAVFFAFCAHALILYP